MSNLMPTPAAGVAGRRATGRPWRSSRAGRQLFPRLFSGDHRLAGAPPASHNPLLLQAGQGVPT